MKIYNMGSLNIDYVYRVPHFVQPGETISAYGRFLADLAGGKNISDALKDASLAASICVTRKGAAPSIPYKKEVENLI